MKWLFIYNFVIVLSVLETAIAETTHYDQESLFTTTTVTATASTTTEISADENIDDNGETIEPLKKEIDEPEVSPVTTIEGYLTTNNPKSERSLDLSNTVKLVGSGSENKRSKIVIKKGENGEDFEYEYIYYYYDTDDDNVTNLTSDEDSFKKAEIAKLRNQAEIARTSTAVHSTTPITTTATMTSTATTSSTTAAPTSIRQRQRPTTTKPSSSIITEQITFTTEATRLRNKPHSYSDRHVTNYDETKKQPLDYNENDQFIKLKTLDDEKFAFDDMERTTEFVGKGETKFLPTHADNIKIDQNENVINKMTFDLYAIAQNLSDKNVLHNEIYYETTNPSFTSATELKTAAEISTVSSPSPSLALSSTSTTSTTTEQTSPSSIQNLDSFNLINGRVKLKSRYGINRYKPAKVSTTTETLSVLTDEKYKSSRNNKHKVNIAENTNENANSSYKVRYGSRGRLPIQTSTQTILETSSESRIYSRPKLPLGQRRRNYLTSTSTTTTASSMTEASSSLLSSSESEKKTNDEDRENSSDHLDSSLSSSTISATNPKNSRSRLYNSNLIRPFRGRNNLFLRNARPKDHDLHNDIRTNSTEQQHLNTKGDRNQKVKNYNSVASSTTKPITGGAKTKSSTAATISTSTITVRKLNPLLARRKLKFSQSSTTTPTTTTTLLSTIASLNPIDSDENEQQPTDSSLGSDSGEDNSSVSTTASTTSTTTTTSTTPEPRGLNKLLSGRRRILSRTIGA